MELKDDEHSGEERTWAFLAVTALSDSSTKIRFWVLSDTENGLLLDELDRNIYAAELTMMVLELSRDG